MLRVVEEASQIAPDGSRGVVVVESDCPGPTFEAAFAELDTQRTVELAQGWAATKGCAPACLNGNKTSPYPVNADRVPLEQVRGPKNEMLPQTHPMMQPAAYRIDVPVARSFR